MTVNGKVEQGPESASHRRFLVHGVLVHAHELEDGSRVVESESWERVLAAKGNMGDEPLAFKRWLAGGRVRSV